MPRSPDGWGRRPHKWRGRWRAYLTVGYKHDGKANRKYVYGKTEGECAKKLDAVRKAHQDGVVDNTIPLGSYLDEWLERAARNVRDSTLRGYRSKMKRIQSRSGRTRLADLKPLQIQRWVEQISDEVSANAAAQSRELLGQALDDAVRFGLMAKNPARATRSPKVNRRKPNVWTAHEVQAFLNATAADAAPYHPLFYVALTTGLRPGELLALEWGDIGHDSIRVERTITDPAKRLVGPPKTRSSFREVPLATDARDVLLAYRRARAWDGVEGIPVFTTPDGRRSHHSNVTRSLRVWAKKAGVRADLKVHDLRHTYASMAIASGMDVAELARRLGHANPGITLRTYVHFFERRDRRPAFSLSDLLGGGIRGGTEGDVAN